MDGMIESGPATQSRAATVIRTRSKQLLRRDGLAWFAGEERR